MKNKGRGKIGDVALELDISKVYNRVNWLFLRFMLSKNGFADRFIDWIMICVSIVKYHIAFNGNELGSIVPSHRLSSYLFVICIEGLGYML